MGFCENVSQERHYETVSKEKITDFGREIGDFLDMKH